MRRAFLMGRAVRLDDLSDPCLNLVDRVQLRRGTGWFRFERPSFVRRKTVLGSRRLSRGEADAGKTYTGSMSHVSSAFGECVMRRSKQTEGCDLTRIASS